MLLPSWFLVYSGEGGAQCELYLPPYCKILLVNGGRVQQPTGYTISHSGGYGATWCNLWHTRTAYQWTGMHGHCGNVGQTVSFVFNSYSGLVPYVSCLTSGLT